MTTCNLFAVNVKKKEKWKKASRQGQGLFFFDMEGYFGECRTKYIDTKEIRNKRWRRVPLIWTS